MNRNEFALSLVETLPLICVFLVNERSLLKRILLAFCFSIGIIVIMRTQSRGAFLGMGFVLLGILFDLFFLQKGKKHIAIVSVLVCSFILINRMPQASWDRIQSITSYEEDVSSMHRIYFWRGAWKMMKTHPLLGVGAGNAANQMQYYVTEVSLSSRTDAQASVHNMFLQVGADNGIIAFFIFLALIFKSSLDVWKIIISSRSEKSENSLYIKNINVALEISFVGWLLCGFFGTSFYWITAHVITALIASSRKIYKKEFSGFYDTEPLESGSSLGLGDQISRWVIRHRMKDLTNKYLKSIGLSVNKYKHRESNDRKVRL